MKNLETTPTSFEVFFVEQKIHTTQDADSARFSLQASQEAESFETRNDQREKESTFLCSSASVNS